MGRISAHAPAQGGVVLNRPTVLAWTRHGVVLVGGFIAGSRGISALSAWRAWHALAASDRSAAELYQTAATLDLSVVAISIALAALVWWLLRPSDGSPLP